jgi:hypothetical protein
MIPREQQIQQSVQDFVRDQLTALGYIPDVVDLRDSFPTVEERATELKKTQVSLGFIMDPGGRLMELGTDLTQRTHSIEFWTFGVSHEHGENVAYTLRAITEDAPGGLIPLKDVGVEDQPVIDQLQLDDMRRPTVQRQISSDPRPWDMFVWTTVIRLIDTYYPSLVN